MSRRRWVITFAKTKRGKLAWRVVEVRDGREQRPKYIPSSKTGITDQTPEGYQRAFERAVASARRSARNRGGLVCVKHFPNPNWDATEGNSERICMRSCCEVKRAQDRAMCCPDLFGGEPECVRRALSATTRPNIVHCEPACERVARRRDGDED